MKDKESRKRAVALQYSVGMEAPVVKGKGTGLVAEQMIALAKENQIPIQEDPSLVEILSKLQLEQRIPEQLYSVVAEILATIYQAEKKAGSSDHD